MHFRGFFGQVKQKKYTLIYKLWLTGNPWCTLTATLRYHLPKRISFRGHYRFHWYPHCSLQVLQMQNTYSTLPLCTHRRQCPIALFVSNNDTMGDNLTVHCVNCCVFLAALALTRFRHQSQFLKVSQSVRTEIHAC